MNWTSVPIGNVIDSSQYGLSLLSDPNGDLPIVGMKGIQDGRVQVDVNICVTLSDEDAHSYLLKDGDILINRTNSPDLVGKAGIYRGNEKAVFASYLVRLELNRKLADPDYVIQILNSEEGQREIKKLATRAVGQANINPTTLKNHFHIPLPQLDEQERIRDVLLTWDLAIEKTESLIEAKENQLQWLRRQIATGKTRLSDSTGKWKKVRLSEVLTEHQELSTGSEEVCSVSVHKGVINQVEHLGRVYSANNTSKYNLVKPGDIVYTKSPTGDFPLGIIKQSKLDRNVIVSPLYGVFTPSSIYLGVILDCYFESDVNTKNYLNPIVQKGAKNTISITSSRFLSNELFLPVALEDQKRIASILQTARGEIDLLKVRTDAYRKQKRGLMQKLLTGQWRVKAG